MTLWTLWYANDGEDRRIFVTGGRRGRDRIVIGYTTICAISTCNPNPLCNRTNIIHMITSVSRGLNIYIMYNVQCSL